VRDLIREKFMRIRFLLENLTLRFQKLQIALKIVQDKKVNYVKIYQCEKKNIFFWTKIY